MFKNFSFQGPQVHARSLAEADFGPCLSPREVCADAPQDRAAAATANPPRAIDANLHCRSVWLEPGSDAMDHLAYRLSRQTLTPSSKPADAIGAPSTSAPTPYVESSELGYHAPIEQTTLSSVPAPAPQAYNVTPTHEQQPSYQDGAEQSMTDFLGLPGPDPRRARRQLATQFMNDPAHASAIHTQTMAAMAGDESHYTLQNPRGTHSQPYMPQVPQYAASHPPAPDFGPANIPVGNSDGVMCDVAMDLEANIAELSHKYNEDVRRLSRRDAARPTRSHGLVYHRAGYSTRDPTRVMRCRRFGEREAMHLPRLMKRSEPRMRKRPKPEEKSPPQAFRSSL